MDTVSTFFRGRKLHTSTSTREFTTHDVLWVARIGDELTITIKGTKLPAKVVEFGQKPIPRFNREPQSPFPGMYTDFSKVRLKLITGEELWHYMQPLEMEYNQLLQRTQQYEMLRRQTGKYVPRWVPVARLPLTPFWETDIVVYEGVEHIIEAVNYLAFPSASSEITYRIIHRDRSIGGSRIVSGETLTLLERGNVWRLAHREAVSFPTVYDLANFYLGLGEYQQVPFEGSLMVSPETALRALTEGVADTFSMSAFYPSMSRQFLIRFIDRNVGEEVREGMLKDWENKVTIQ
jgi:hypothetical protein